jgi:hypothetical protein
MPSRNVVKVSNQTGITAGTTSDEFILPYNAQSVLCIADLTAGSPSTGAKLQFSVGTKEELEAGTATFYDDATLGNQLADFNLSTDKPVRAVRLNVTDGTWTFRVAIKTSADVTI